MNILVTGATGFIGSTLIEELKKHGHRLRALVLPGEPTELEEDPHVEVVRGDITIPDSLAGICDHIDCVFHLAARVADWGSMGLFRSVIVEGTRNLLRECVGKANRFVYASSIAAYGMGRHLRGFDEESQRICTGMPYCDAKIEAEDLVVSYTFGTPTRFTIIRPANVIGPGSVWVRDVAEAFLRGPVPLLDGGKYSGSFVYVKNLVDGMIKASLSPTAENRTYNLRDDYSVTWKEYLQEIGSVLGKKPGPSVPTKFLFKIAGLVERAYLPFFPARPPITRLAVVIMGYDNDVDNSRAKKELSWKTVVPFEAALEEIKDWLRANYEHR